MSFLIVSQPRNHEAGVETNMRDLCMFRDIHIRHRLRQHVRVNMWLNLVKPRIACSDNGNEICWRTTAIAILGPRQPYRAYSLQHTFLDVQRSSMLNHDVLYLRQSLQLIQYLINMHYPPQSETTARYATARYPVPLCGRSSRQWAQIEVSPESSGFSSYIGRSASTYHPLISYCVLIVSHACS